MCIRDRSNIQGIYRTGQVTAGFFNVVFSREGYRTKSVLVNLINGVVSIANVALAPDSLVTTSIPVLSTVAALDVYPNPFLQNTTINYQLTELNAPTYMVITDLVGRQLMESPITSKTGFFSLGADWTPGVYFIRLISEGKSSIPLKVAKSKT